MVGPISNMLVESVPDISQCLLHFVDISDLWLTLCFQVVAQVL